MKGKTIRIGVVATGSPVAAETAEQVNAFASRNYPEDAPKDTVVIEFHPQCFMQHGHFAGDDSARADAFVEIANDPSYDALWIGRGGYGACRVAENILSRLTDTARDKAYLGYSDAGMILAGLYRKGFADVAHGPMPTDIVREGGEAAVGRALDWLIHRSPETLEPGITAAMPVAAFNITILSQLLGTPLQPDLSGHVLMLEEVSEYMYRIDRSLFHITSNAEIRRVAGIRLGRCSLVPPNDPDFGRTEEDITMEWCARSSIPYLGRADIGHDIDNRIVPFGRLS